jgi:hypothetical protein
MCFSTTASFGSGIILSVIGIITIKNTSHRSQLMFASIPFIFAVQQFAEGFVWLSLLNSTNQFQQQLAMYSFLVFAMVFWPAWVPVSMLLIEKKKNRRRILYIFSVLGVLISFLSILYLIFYKSEAQITSHHIHYTLNVPFGAQTTLAFIYLIPAVLSNFISSIKGVVFMGILILLSYLVSKFFYGDFVLSVWCFFSALISITIYFILRMHHMAEKTSSNTRNIHV